MTKADASGAETGGGVVEAETVGDEVVDTTTALVAAAEVGRALVAAVDGVVGAGAGAVATAGVALVVSGGRTVGLELFPLQPASRTALTSPTDTTLRPRVAIRMRRILNDTQEVVCTLSTGSPVQPWERRTVLVGRVTTLPDVGVQRR